MNKEQKAFLKAHGFHCLYGKWCKDVNQYPFPLSARVVVDVRYHYHIVSKGYPFAPVTAAELEGGKACAAIQNLEIKEND